MHDQGKDIPVSTREGGDVLGFSLEDLFIELEESFYGCDIRKPGDLDDQQLMDRFKCGKETVRFRMKPLLKVGTWERIKVVDQGERVMVYRKIS